MPAAAQTASRPRPPAGSPRPPDPERAWAAYEPSPRRPWDLARAAHLYRRAGFGATWGQLQQALKAGPRRTIDRLLKPPGDLAAFQRTHDDYERAVTSVAALRAWWLRRMIRTPHPLGEKLTLFWHDYFAVGAARVGDVSLMQRHVQTLRAGATGPFPALLARVARDPAVHLSLGAKANRKTRPTEHFARQLLERYTVGPGNYSRRDLRDAARAMTGWFVLRKRLRYFQREHDDGEKTVLGTTGRLAAEDLVRIAAGHEATARTVVRRLYRWLVSEADAPGDALLEPLVRAFAADPDVGRLVGTMLRSNLFFSPTAIGRRIKRPVEYAVGIVRALEANVPTTPLAADLARLGEDLYNQPTLGGWAGGRNWINPATLIGRSNLAASLLAPTGPYEGRVDPAGVARRNGQTHADAAGRLLVALLLPPGGEETFERLRRTVPSGADLPETLRKLALAAVTQPEFHLA